MISSSLTTLIYNSIEKVNNNNVTEITKKKYFSALLVILKFHPFAALLYSLHICLRNIF